jgi:type IV pilus assembly protein PilV
MYLSKKTPLITLLTSQQGMTLLEVMIALVIFSIGMLGLAGLQITGLRDSGNAERRTQATVLANDLIERMRANTAGLRANEAAVASGDYTDATIQYGVIDCATPPAPYCEDTSTTAASACTPNQMAVFDAYTVYCQSSQRMPAGSLAVLCTDVNGVAATCAATPYRQVAMSWTNVNDFGSINKNMILTVRP